MCLKECAGLDVFGMIELIELIGLKMAGSALTVTATWIAQSHERWPLKWSELAACLVALPAESPLLFCSACSAISALIIGHSMLCIALHCHAAGM